MKTLIIKLTAEQQAQLRNALDIEESEPCEFIGIKLGPGGVTKAKGDDDGPDIIAYNPPPIGVDKDAQVALV